MSANIRVIVLILDTMQDSLPAIEQLKAMHDGKVGFADVTACR